MNRSIFAWLMLGVIFFTAMDADASGRRRKKYRRGGDRIEQGTAFVDLNYGFPNLFSAVLRLGFENGSTYDMVESNFGPIEIRYEHMLSKRIGLGLMVNYSASGLDYKETQTEFDPNTGNSSQMEYDYSINVNRLRVLPRFNFHFGNGKNFDAYVSTAVGYVNWSIKGESNDPEFNEETAVENAVNVTGIGYRVAVGIRTMFSSSIGGNVEFGLGSGALVNAGLSIRF